MHEISSKIHQKVLPRFAEKANPPSAARQSYLPNRNETRIAAISSLVQPRTPRHLLRYPARRAAYIRLPHLTSPHHRLSLAFSSLSLSLASSPSTTTLSSSTTRFINNTEQEQRRIGVILFSNQRRANPAAAVAGRWGPPIGRWWGSAWRRKGGGAASNAAPPPRPCGAVARPAPGLYATLAESGTGRRGGRILGWT